MFLTHALQFHLCPIVGRFLKNCVLFLFFTCYYRTGLCDVCCCICTVTGLYCTDCLSCYWLFHTFVLFVNKSMIQLAIYLFSISFIGRENYGSSWIEFTRNWIGLRFFLLFSLNWSVRKINSKIYFYYNIYTYVPRHIVVGYNYIQYQ